MGCVSVWITLSQILKKSSIPMFVPTNGAERYSAKSEILRDAEELAELENGGTTCDFETDPSKLSVR